MKRLTGDVGQIQEGRPISSPWPRRFARVRHIFLRGKFFSLLRALPTNQPPPLPPPFRSQNRLLELFVTVFTTHPLLSFLALDDQWKTNEKNEEEGEGEDESERNEENSLEQTWIRARLDEEKYEVSNDHLRFIVDDWPSVRIRHRGMTIVEFEPFPSLPPSLPPPPPFLPTFVRVIVFTYGLRN